MREFIFGFVRYSIVNVSLSQFSGSLGSRRDMNKEPVCMSLYVFVCAHTYVYMGVYVVRVCMIA